MSMIEATAAEFGMSAPLLPRAPRAPKVASKAAKAPKAPALASYAVGPTPVKARKGTWRLYMLRTIQGAATVADATKAHKAKARRAGFKPSAKLDFKWALASGYIVAR
jgi:hypothetical protein